MLDFVNIQCPRGGVVGGLCFIKPCSKFLVHTFPALPPRQSSISDTTTNFYLSWTNVLSTKIASTFFKLVCKWMY